MSVSIHTYSQLEIKEENDDKDPNDCNINEN